jgi:hypothetical protein
MVYSHIEFVLVSGKDRLAGLFKLAQVEGLPGMKPTNEIH